MKRNNFSPGLLSLVGGIVLMATASLFDVECQLAEPGGINEGGQGFPIPYYSCGAWGESFSWPIAAIDFVILSLAVYLLLKIAMKLAQRH